MVCEIGYRALGNVGQRKVTQLGSGGDHSWTGWETGSWTPVLPQASLHWASWGRHVPSSEAVFFIRVS